jgi:transcriptional regulator PpsR
VTHPFIKPDELGAFSDFAPELASMFVALDGDIVLIVGQDGVIQNVAVNAAIKEPSTGAWIGRHWAETVTGSTRRKIELLLQEVDIGGVTRRREVNHQSSGGPDIPMSYSALRLGKEGPVIAVGRDLRAVAAIQQHMISAQQDMERNYWALRRDQGQQRELDQVASDAVLVVNAADLQISKSNAVADNLLLQADGSLCQQLQMLLFNVIASGKASELRTRLKSKGTESPLLDIFLTPLRNVEPADTQLRLLVRARRVGKQEPPEADLRTAITDAQGRILMASDSLIAMCAEAGSDVLYGKSLLTLLDNAQGVLASLPRLVLQYGLVHIPSVILGGHLAPACEAEVSATLINDGDQERIGFCIRVHSTSSADTWTQALQTLLASQLPLTELLQQVQNLTEQQAISDSLRSTGANMIASASMLGISVAGLTQRLERLGIDRAHFTAH